MKTKREQEREKKRVKMIGYVLLAIIAIGAVIALANCSGEAPPDEPTEIGGDGNS